MNSTQPRSSSTPPGLSQILCNHQDPFTGKKCHKKYSKRSNLNRHIRKKHKAGKSHSTAASEVESADSDYDVDDSRSMFWNDFEDDNIPVTESLSEARHTRSAPPTLAASSEDSDLPPLPPALHESAQMFSAVNTNTTAATTFATGGGLDAADAWLINESVAPRSHPVGGPFYSPSNMITSAPRMASSLPESCSQALNPSSLGSGQFQMGSPMPEHVDQTLHQFADDFGGPSNPVQQDLGQVVGSLSQNLTQILNHLVDKSRTGSPISQGYSKIANPSLQDFDKMLSPFPHQFSRTASPVPQGQHSNMSPFPHQFSRTASPVPQGQHSNMNPSPYQLSRTASPVPQGQHSNMSPSPYQLSRTASPVPQDPHSIMSTMSQAFPRMTSPMPASGSAIQAPATSDFGTAQSPVPHGANHPANYSSKPSASFDSLIAAPIEPDGPGDLTVQDSGVVSDTDSETPSNSTSTPVAAVTGRKRKLSHGIASRSLQASVSNLVPSYSIKESKKFPGQMRGIGWLEMEGKTKFEDFYRGLLAQWGVTPEHKGTCVLVPEAYRPLEPLDIMAKVTQDGEKHAAPGTPRAFFSMYDHGTTVVRARAWFNKWLRYGAQLDNFIGCGDCAPMDASHMCHHDHCLIHVTYEAADVNVSRQDCCQEARRLRQQNAADVPEHCSNPKHDPPCLMQHAALSTPETYYIQFAVLRQAKGLETAPPVPRPRRWRYATYETQIPCIFPSVRVQSHFLTAQAVPARKEGKPELTCKFCGRLRGWQGVISFWTHLVQTHKEVSTDARLAEIIRTGDLWRAYWLNYSDGGKKDNPTMKKLRQLEDPDFCWQDVLDWNLHH